MAELSPTTISHEECLAKRRVLREQLTDVRHVTARLDCAGCGQRIPLFRAFKCFYCHLWFCRACAETHFSDEKQEVA